MMEMDGRLKVLILRTLGLSQEDTAGLLHYAKQAVGDVDRWFRDAPEGEALALVEDQRIKRLVNRDFPSLSLAPSQLMAAAQVIGDDILLHYGRVHPRATAAEEAGVAPMYLRRLEEHWESLRQQTMTFREQLVPPSSRQLFGADVCRTLHRAAESGTSLLSTTAWKQPFEAPVEVKLSAGSEAGAVDVRLLSEGSFVFPHLVSHLSAEFPGFSEFEAWKTRLGYLARVCLEQARGVTLSCSTAAGLPYMRAGAPEWLSFQFPAYVCQFVLDNPGVETAPSLRTELQPDGSWKVTPEEFPAITIAGGSGDSASRCREVLAAEVSRVAGLQAWQQMRSDLTALESGAERLRLMLTTVIERGDFKGTCRLCENYFVRSRTAQGASS
jgi:hypothetical protein